MNAIQETSRIAYKDIKPSLSRRQAQVLAAIETYGPMTNSELSERLGWTINTVTPRTNELVNKGVLAEHGRRQCRVTGRQALVWGKFKYGLF